MISRKCDRCKKFYEHYPVDNATNKYNTLRLSTKDIYDTKYQHISNDFDLCPECMENLIRFLSGYSISDDIEILSGLDIV